MPLPSQEAHGAGRSRAVPGPWHASAQGLAGPGEAGPQLPASLHALGGSTGLPPVQSGPSVPRAQDETGRCCTVMQAPTRHVVWGAPAGYCWCFCWQPACRSCFARHVLLLLAIKAGMMAGCCCGQTLAKGAVLEAGLYSMQQGCQWVDLKQRYMAFDGLHSSACLQSSDVYLAISG